MCPNINHFDAVDFSECHSEEVISSFDAQFIMKFNRSLTPLFLFLSKISGGNDSNE